MHPDLLGSGWVGGFLVLAQKGLHLENLLGTNGDSESPVSRPKVDKFSSWSVVWPVSEDWFLHFVEV